MTKLGGLLATLGLGLLLLSLALGPTSHDAEPGSDGDPVARGRALFLAKGCAICHRHADLAGLGPDNGAFIGPNLTHYQPDADFVRRWLHDPSAIRPGTAMPDLELSESEITALIAFLGQDATAPPR